MLEQDRVRSVLADVSEFQNSSLQAEQVARQGRLTPRPSLYSSQELYSAPEPPAPVLQTPRGEPTPRRGTIRAEATPQLLPRKLSRQASHREHPGDVTPQLVVQPRGRTGSIAQALPAKAPLPAPHMDEPPAPLPPPKPAAILDPPVAAVASPARRPSSTSAAATLAVQAAALPGSETHPQAQPGIRRESRAASPVGASSPAPKPASQSPTAAEPSHVPSPEPGARATTEVAQQMLDAVTETLLRLCGGADLLGRTVAVTSPEMQPPSPVSPSSPRGASSLSGPPPPTMYPSLPHSLSAAHPTYPEEPHYDTPASSGTSGPASSPVVTQHQQNHSSVEGCQGNQSGLIGWQPQGGPFGEGASSGPSSPIFSPRGYPPGGFSSLTPAGHAAGPSSGVAVGLPYPSSGGVQPLWTPLGGYIIWHPQQVFSQDPSWLLRGPSGQGAGTQTGTTEPESTAGGGPQAAAPVAAQVAAVLAAAIPEPGAAAVAAAVPELPAGAAGMESPVAAVAESVLAGSAAVTAVGSQGIRSMPAATTAAVAVNRRSSSTSGAVRSTATAAYSGAVSTGAGLSSIHGVPVAPVAAGGRRASSASIYRRPAVAAATPASSRRATMYAKPASVPLSAVQEGAVEGDSEAAAGEEEISILPSIADSPAVLTASKGKLLWHFFADTWGGICLLVPLW